MTDEYYAEVAVSIWLAGVPYDDAIDIVKRLRGEPPRRLPFPPMRLN